MRNVVLGCACTAAVAVMGCGDDAIMKQDAGVDAFVPDPALSEVALIPSTPNRDLDLLFVIDDSPSMLDKQTNMKNSFPIFAEALASGGTMPSLHIGVVSTDVGTFGADDSAPGPGVGSGPSACSMYGKDGLLQNAAFGTMNQVVNGPFIIDDNGTRNYTGTLAAAFSSVANVGAIGCGFEQPLHAMKRSFDQGSNAGFIRASARLGVIVLTDEDDCSMAHSTLIGSDTSTLGPLQSFRCTRFGVTCDVGGATPADMNTTGVKSSCHSNEQSAYLTDVARYKAFLQAVKPDPRDVMFAALLGDPKVEVELRAPAGGGTPIPAVKHSCSYIGASTLEEVADPGVRLADVAKGVRRGSYTSLCTSYLGQVMADLGQRVKALAGDPCLERPIALPWRCQVFDQLSDGTEVPLPECTATSGMPCYSLATDTATCPAAQNLKASIMRAFPAAADTWTSVRCAL